MDLLKELDIYYSMVYAEHITETKLVNLLIVIKEKCEKILEFASFYDYDQNHAFNGYRSSVLFVVKFLEAVHCTKLNEDFDGTVDEIILICNALNKTLETVLEFHEKSLKQQQKSNQNSNRCDQCNQIDQQNQINLKECNHTNNKSRDDQVFNLQMPIDRQSLVDAFESMQDNDIPFIFNKYYEFFYKGTNLNSINQTMLSNFLENFDVLSWFKTLTSSTFTDTSLFLNATQLGLTDFSNSQLIKNWLPFLSSTKPYIVETITIKRQLEFLICPITFELKHNPMKFQVLNNRKKFIKCKLLRNTVNSSGHLLIYLFPSDYFNKENDISNSFLSDWSRKLHGCSILVPELIYDKNEQFITPLQLQDCLDVYLWAIGKNNFLNKNKLLTKMPKQFSQKFSTNNSNENLSIKRTHHPTSHSRSSSIGGLSSYFNNSLSSNTMNQNNANSSVYSNVLKNSEQVLDGIPEHITLSGDSSGGNLACSLLLVLNDLKTKFNVKDIKLPNALVLAYAPFNLRDYSPIMLTSRFNYSLSPIIALTTVESNLPLPEIENDLIDLNVEKDNTDKLETENLEADLKKEIDVSSDEKQREPKKQKRKKRSNSMNKYLVERLNKCKLSDFFQQFGYLNQNQSKDDLTDHDLNEDESDSDYDLAYPSSNEHLNLSYFTKTLMNYLSQYYNTHISTQLNHSFAEETDEKLDFKNVLNNEKLSNCEIIQLDNELVQKLDKIDSKIDKLFDKNMNNERDDSYETRLNNKFTKTISKSENLTQNRNGQKINQLNLRPDPENIKKLNNQTNESLITQVQNAFTMFRLFFNGNEKKQTHFEWNKEIVEKIFTEQREKAFLDLTSRPYISPAFYDDFKSLENVSIYLLNSTCDMFLDDNICMAKKWAGKIKKLNYIFKKFFLK